MNKTTELSPAAKADANERRFQYAKTRAHDDFLKKADECIEFFFSKHWDEEDLKKLRKTRRPALTVNKIKPVIISMMGEYFEQRATVKFLPDANGDLDSSRALNKLYIDETKKLDYDRKELDLVMEGLMTSRAYLDLRVEQDDAGVAHLRLSSPNPKNVIPDPDADSYNPDDWNDVMVISRQTIQDIEKSYGKVKVKEVRARGRKITGDDDLLPSRTNTFGDNLDDEYSRQEATLGDEDDVRREYLVIERQFKTMEDVDFFVNKETGDAERVPVDWTDEAIEEHQQEYGLTIEKRRAQVIRWRVSTGSVLLFDKPSPYDFFTLIPYFPVFYRGMTAGVVEDLRDPQRNYNKLRSQELHIVNGTSNSGWKVRKGALANMTVDDLEDEGAKIGLVVEVNGDPKDIERIDPVQIPQGLDRISTKADADIGSISGIQDEARGVARADVAGKAINARRQAVLRSMSLYLQNLAYTRELFAKRVLNLFQRYYDEERTIAITTGALKDRTEQITINQEQEGGQILNDITAGNYNVSVVAAAVRDTFENGQFEELKALAELGVPVPSHLFVEYSSLDRKEEIAEMLSDAPTEEEQELSRKEREAALAERMANAEARMAAAELSRARARKVLDEIRTGSLTEEQMIKLEQEAKKLSIKETEVNETIGIRKEALRIEAIKALLEDEKADMDRAAQMQKTPQAGETTKTGDDT